MSPLLARKVELLRRTIPSAYRQYSRPDLLTLSLSAHDPGCVKMLRGKNSP
jgi:hypothetical protein